MISERVKATKAYQATQHIIPLTVWESIESLAAEHLVDLNSVQAFDGDTFIFGEPRTRLTVHANITGATFTTAIHHVRKSSTSEFDKTTKGKFRILRMNNSSIREGDTIELVETSADLSATGQRAKFEVSRVVYDCLYQIWLKPIYLSR